MSSPDIKRFIWIALECSVYVDPLKFGMSYAELCEAGRCLNFKQGEIADTLASDRQIRPLQEGRVMLDPTMITNWTFYNAGEPEFRNFDALDFILSDLQELAREVGLRQACLDRDVLLERAAAKGISKHDMEVAITLHVILSKVKEDKSLISLNRGWENAELPSVTRQKMLALRFPTSVKHDELRATVYPIVRDVLSRRNDGRAALAEPFDAFSERLTQLGYGAYKLWWAQISAELRRSDTQQSPVAVLVLAAALVEGALTFVVKHARNSHLGVFGSTDFDKSPNYWRLDKLVESAGRGGDSAILDQATQARVAGLIQKRQRVHAGRILTDFVTGVPDLRPEEARDAKTVAELVVRRVIDWLDKYPPR